MEMVVQGEDKLQETGSWVEPFVKAASACDKFFNCAYVKKQLEDEWKQEARAGESAVVRVWSRLETGMEVEMYRQLLFEENSVEPSQDDTPTDQRQQSMSKHYIPELARTDS